MSGSSHATGSQPRAAGLPGNLHQRSLTDERRSLSERMEQKFFVPPRRMGLVVAHLVRTCRWDAHYPEEQINSLYFDTHGLEQHERSLSGEFAKDKIRIRWYGSEYDPHDIANSRSSQSPQPDPEARIPLWLELKSRRGFASTKLRQAMDVPGGSLAPRALATGIVPPTTLVHTLADFGFFPAGRLYPIVVVSYWRRRFVEPATGMRVSLDSNIRSSMVLPGVGRGERGLALPGAVVEVKGPRFDLPPSLRLLAEIGSSWTRYSKYSFSLEAHGSTIGAVSRLWPSGVVDV
jgi:VTC domain